MQFPLEIAAVIARRFEDAEREYPQAILPDGWALWAMLEQVIVAI